MTLLSDTSFHFSASSSPWGIVWRKSSSIGLLSSNSSSSFEKAILVSASHGTLLEGTLLDKSVEKFLSDSSLDFLLELLNGVSVSV